MAKPAKPLVVAANKRAYAATLEDACLDVGITPQTHASPRERFTELAVHCKLSPNTLVANLAEESPPHWPTIKALAEGTRIPRTTWYLRLGLLDADDIAKGLAYDAPPELLSQAQQRALDLVEGLDDEAAFEHLDFWESTPSLSDLRHNSPRPVRRRYRRAGGAR